MKIDFNQYAAAALQKAEEDAQACRQTYIGTEHILLGLLDQRESLAGQVLALGHHAPLLVLHQVAPLVAIGEALVPEPGLAQSSRAHPGLVGGM